MRNSFNFYPVLYKIITLIVCFLLVLLYNRARAEQVKTSTTKQVMIDKNKCIVYNRSNSPEDNVHSCTMIPLKPQT